MTISENKWNKMIKKERMKIVKKQLIFKAIPCCTVYRDKEGNLKFEWK